MIFVSMRSNVGLNALKLNKMHNWNMKHLFRAYGKNDIKNYLQKIRLKILANVENNHDPTSGSRSFQRPGTFKIFSTL